MFKKLFRSLTQSKEEIYLEELEKQAQGLLTNGAPQMAKVLRRFGGLKKSLDEKIEISDKSLLEIDDLAEHAERICDQVRACVKDLAATECELAEVVSSGDFKRFASHFDDWRTGNLSLLRAYATLYHVTTGQGPDDPLSLTVEKKTALDECIERLEVEIRTAERIKFELGG